MSNIRNRINLWADASYRGGRIGVGWVLKHFDEEREGRLAFTGLNPEEEKHGSIIAEVLGVSEVLKTVVNLSGKVDLRLDAMGVIQALRQRNIVHCFDKQPIPPLLVSLFDRAVKAVIARPRIHVFHRDVSESENMHRAHTLSRGASHKDYGGDILVLGNDYR